MYIKIIDFCFLGVLTKKPIMFFFFKYNIEILDMFIKLIPIILNSVKIKEKYKLTQP